MRKESFKKLAASALSLVTALSMLPAMTAYAKNLEWETVDGKQYWYENDVKQGTVNDGLGIIGDGTNRGREICDPANDTWYWLDSVYDGAKAEGKEVWIPYVYQDELVDYSEGPGRIANGISDEAKIAELAALSKTDEADMSAQVEDAIRNRRGKWVRYDGNGGMLKGWVKIEGDLAKVYPEQEGNVYYYDKKTGLMAKGVVQISGKYYEFDETTGVLIGEIIEESSSETTTYLTLRTEESKREYQKPRTEYQRDTRTVYVYGNEEHPDLYTKSQTYTKYDGVEQQTSESEYEVVEYKQGNSNYMTNFQTKSWSKSYDSTTKTLYLYNVSTYEHAPNSDNTSKSVSTSYRKDGTKSYENVSEYTYNNDGDLAKEIETHTSYDSDGTTVSYINKTRTEYTYENRQTKEELVYNLPTEDGETEYLSSKYVYYYDNGKRTKYESYYGGSANSAPVLSSVTEYREETLEDGGKKQIQESFEVTNGEKTDVVTYKYVYFYNAEGDQTRSENWSKRYTDGELVLTSYSIYEKDENDNGYIRYYTSYSVDNSTDPATEYASYKTEDVYEKIGNRTVNTKETWYSDTDGDRRIEVDYYTLYDRNFTWSTEGMTAGETRTRTNKTYNADDSEYYTYTTTYKAVEVTY